MGFILYNLSFINIIRERKSKPWWWHHPKPASTHYCQICWPSQVPLSNNEQRPNNGERLDIIPFSSAMVAQGNATSRAGSASNYAHLIWRSFSCEPYLKKSLRALCGLRTSLRITTRHSPTSRSSMVTAEEYKQAKIDFVSNLSGSGKYDLLVVFAVAGVCLHFLSQLKLMHPILILLSPSPFLLFSYSSIIST